MALSARDLRGASAGGVPRGARERLHALTGLARLAGIPVAAADDAVSLERIMADPDWMGASPESPHWSSDGAAILFDRKVAGCEERDLIALSLPDGAERVVSDNARAAMRPWFGTRSPDGHPTRSCAAVMSTSRT